MGIAERLPPRPLRPEQHLLTERGLLDGHARAFLRGEIDAAQYAELTLAEINRRAPLDPLAPPETSDVSDVPAPPIDRDRVSTTVVEPSAFSPEAARSLVLAQAFVSHRISGRTFLALIRDL